MLLNQRAMLLPKLHSLFVFWFKDTPPQPSNSSDYSASLPSNQCLFVRLAKQLSPHIFFCCKVKKLGTVIYRKDGDILEVLTFALVRQSLPDLTEESQLQRGGTFPDEQLATIEEASSAINHRLPTCTLKGHARKTNKGKVLQAVRLGLASVFSSTNGAMLSVVSFTHALSYR